MNLQITSRHGNISQETQEFIKKKISSINKFTDLLKSCHVIVDSDTNGKCVEIIAKINGNSATAKSVEENLGKAVDAALQKISRQLKKYNDKIKDHKATKVLEVTSVEE